MIKRILFFSFLMILSLNLVFADKLLDYSTYDGKKFTNLGVNSSSIQTISFWAAGDGWALSAHAHGDNIGNFVIAVGSNRTDVYGINGWTSDLGASVSDTKRWHHYVLVNDNSNHILYLDGELVAQSNSVAVSKKYPIVAGAGGYNFVMRDYMFGGNVANVNVFNRVLSGEEIKEIYSSEREGVLSGEVRLPWCNDMDNGWNYAVRGQVSDSMEYNMNDYCIDEYGEECSSGFCPYLVEGYCNAFRVYMKVVGCASGCVNGECSNVSVEMYTQGIYGMNGDESYKLVIQNNNQSNSSVGVIVEANKSDSSLIDESKGVVPNLACYGCMDNNMCLPLGFRLNGSYCALGGNMTLQKNSNDESSTCENNFECDSNVCVSGKCVSPGLLDAIINWFKKLFG